MALVEALGQVGMRPVSREGDIGGVVFAAERLQARTQRPRAGEREVEAPVRAEVEDGRADGLDIVSEAEIAGVEDAERFGTPLAIPLKELGQS
jgi:hypothetical protein